jgi:hypothetical protein
LKLDGSADNSGSSGAGELIVPTGADRPQYVDGHLGQGLYFGKGGTIAIPYHFDQAEHPQATITMWIKLNEDSSYERELFSLGPGNGLQATVTNKRTISIRSNRQGVHDVPFPLGEWVFVAGVVDNTDGTIRIQKNDDLFEAGSLEIKPPYSLDVTAPGSDERANYIFIGADDFNSAAKEMRHIALDDVRLYASALSQGEIDTIRNSGPAAIADRPEAIGETEKNDGTSPVITLPATTTPELPNTLPDATANDEDEPVRPDYREIASLPDDGPGFRVGFPPAEDSSGSASTEIFGTAGRDLSGMDTSGIARPIDMSGAAGSSQPENDTQDDGTVTRQQGLEPEPAPIIRAEGDPSYTSISGKRGERTASIDFGSIFMGGISWSEGNDHPCLIRILQYDDRDERKIWGQCDGSNTFATIIGERTGEVTLGADQAVGRLQVCKSKFSDRLKGVQIHGDRIHPDGRTTYEPDGYARDQFPNCGAWQTDVSCPSGQKSTGLIIHYNGEEDGRAAITGLQLICRTITVD